MEFTFERPQDRSFGYGSANIIEPADNEFPVPTFAVTFPRMNTVSANSLYGRGFGRPRRTRRLHVSRHVHQLDRPVQEALPVPVHGAAGLPDADAAGAAQVKPRATFVLKKPSRGTDRHVRRDEPVPHHADHGQFDSGVLVYGTRTQIGRRHHDRDGCGTRLGRG
jgi:hypothetical protein